MPSLPSADHADDPTLKIAAMNVRESKLVPYVLSGVMGYDGQNRYFLVGIDRARTANPSKIWAEAGYWDCEIVQIGGRDVVTLTDPGRRRLLWDDADPVQLVIRTRSGSLKTVDTFTRVAFAH